MNAPENTTAAYPINLAHEVLLKSDSALCVDEVARAIVGKKPTKAEIKSVAKLLKEISDLVLIEMRPPRTGGVPFYRLIAASESLPTKTYPPETLRAMIEEHEAEKAGELSFLAPEDYEIPPADPVLLAQANRALGEQLEAAHSAAGYDPDFTSYNSFAEHIAAIRQAADDLQRIAGYAHDYTGPEASWSALRGVQIMDQLVEEHLFTARHRTAYAIKLMGENDDLRARLDAVTKQSIAETDALTAQIEHLKAELATERQAREAMQEHAGEDAVDVKDAAVGYLVRVTKRKPRYVTQPERAREAALAAVRSGAGRADVLAVVPVGVARRGAEWRGINDLSNGD